MFLSKISVLNFKNYETIDLDFTHRINCLVGKNGVGKTNLLDAVHYLSLCKSYFNPIDSQNIHHRQEMAFIQGEYNLLDKKEIIYCGLKRNSKKSFKRNKKEYAKLSEHIGLIPVVMVSPSDIKLISEGSDERRKFMDAVISQYDQVYLENLIRYNKALNQRNFMLKKSADTNSLDQDTFNIWSEQMVTYGNAVYLKRVEFINDMEPIFQKYYKHISKGTEKVQLRYRSQLNKGNFSTLMHENAEKDKIFQYSTVGIHKDDLDMEIEGYPIKKNGSQGQLKTFLVSLKFAKYDFIKDVTHKKPILLLDDIFDKFDHQRVEQIIQLVAQEGFGQIFITDTSQDRLNKILSNMNIAYKIFLIDDGKLVLDEGTFG